jgi:hypothetical protein
MENQQKKSFKDLFQDKKFLWAIPVFLLLTGGFLWIIADPSGTPVETETPSALNVGVPNAASDSIMGNRLDLSVEGTQDPASQPGAMQGIPGGNKYAYGQRYKPQSGNPAAGAMSSLPDPVTGMATPQNSGSQGFPTGVNRRATPSMPFTESDMRITDDDAVRTPEDGRALAAKRAGLANIVDKQARMERALAAYNQDKQARISRENDKTVIQKVNVDENGQPAVPISSLSNPVRSRNSFFGLYTEDQTKAQQRLLDAEVGTIKAMVYGDQEINGTSSRIKIRLLEPLFVRGIIIPRNTLIYGMGVFSGQRVNLVINQIQYQDRLFPVKIQVFDMDGMAGLYIPNMQNLDLAKQVLSQTIQSGGGGGLSSGVSINNSPSAILANAGLQAAQQVSQGVKQGVARKALQQRAYLKNNYYVLLRNTIDEGLTPGGRTQAPGVTGQFVSDPGLGGTSSPKMEQIRQLQQILQEQQN